MKGMSKMMTDVEFTRIYTFLKQRYGIDMHRKREIMEGRLENYVREKQFATYSAYMDAIEYDLTGTLEKDLVNMLTTNHTFFMRESEHYEYLKKVVLPELREKERVKKDLYIWCGASSTGEEPYTLAMLLKDFFGLEHEKWDTRILATDISTAALSSAVRGTYKKEQIEVLPEQWKRHYLQSDKTGETYTIRDEIKKEVLFRKFNLMEQFPFRRKMHVIFLRNVMIYFDEETKKKLVQKIYELLENGGYFFIGRTETIDRDWAPFQMLQPSIYRK